MQGKRKIQNSLLVICVLLLFMISGCGGNKTVAKNGEGITVKMLDVGQGDALLVRTKDQTILIDTGDVDEREKFLACLKKEGITTIDKMIITHPHADHMGGADVVFKNFTVKEVYDNGQPTTTNLYRTYLKTIKEKSIAYKHLAAGDILDFGDGAVFKVLSPPKGKAEGGGDLNENSIVGRLAYKDFSMLFTGDSTAEAEAQMLSAYKTDLKSTILKSPHHGSKTSSNFNYLKAVAPEAVLISLGRGNEYGHPHKVILDKYEKLKMKIFRTDTDGTITIETNGSTYDIKKEK